MDIVKPARSFAAQEHHGVPGTVLGGPTFEPRKGRKYCARIPDEERARWAFESFYKKSGLVELSSPIHLGLLAEDVGMFVVECFCKSDDFRSTITPTVGKEPVLANTTIVWRIAQGGGWFVNKAGGPVRDMTQGEHVLYEPPQIHERRSVVVQATVTRDSRDVNKPPPASSPLIVEFRIELEKRFAPREVSGFTAQRGHAPVDLSHCHQLRGAGLATGKAILGMLETQLGDTPSIEDPLQIIQERDLIHYRINVLPASSKAPKRMRDAGECTPTFEYTSPAGALGTVNIRTEAESDACVLDTFVLEATFEPKPRVLYTQCKSNTCGESSAKMSTPPLTDVVRYEWNVNVGHLVGRTAGRTVVWTSDGVRNERSVEFTVKAYSILDGGAYPVARGTKRIRLNDDWVSGQAAHVVFIDKERLDEAQSADSVPCEPNIVNFRGTQIANGCFKWASIADILMAEPLRNVDILTPLPDIAKVGHAYLFSGGVRVAPSGLRGRRWTLWRLPVTEMHRLAERTPPGDARWIFVTHKRHPWGMAAKLLSRGTNPRPVESFDGVTDLMRTMQRSKQFKHMSGIWVRALRRRNRFVHLDIKQVFDEPGWTQVPAAGQLGVLGALFGQLGSNNIRGERRAPPQIVISPLHRDHLEVKMDHETRIGAPLNLMNILLTNRIAPWIRIMFRAILRTDSDDIGVQGELESRFPTMFVYRNQANGNQVTVSERDKHWQSSPILMLNQGEQCIVEGDSGL